MGAECTKTPRASTSLRLVWVEQASAMFSSVCTQSLCFDLVCSMVFGDVYRIGGIRAPSCYVCSRMLGPSKFEQFDERCVFFFLSLSLASPNSLTSGDSHLSNEDHLNIIEVNFRARDTV